MKKLREIFTDGRNIGFLFLSVLAAGVASGLYRGVLDNYMAEIVHLNEFDRGVAEFFREIPGLLLVFILAAMYTLSAEGIYKLGSAICLVGMGLHAIVPPDKILVILAVCVFNLGDHILMGMKSTIVLSHAKPGRGGEGLGLQSAVSQVGSLGGFLAVAAVFAFVPAGETAYRLFFAAATLCVLVSCVSANKMRGSSAKDESASRFYFRKKFKKYYMLEVFYGARKQVFITFGPYVLILFYHADAAVISLLFAVSSVACFFLSPLVGKLIDRAGYRIVMIMDTVLLVFVCFSYGFAHHLFPMDTAFVICCASYVLDAIISMASMASNVYVQDISDSPEEVRATISTGISVNHLITVLIALFGGWIWQQLGMEVLFILSAALGLCNSAYAATIKTGRGSRKTAASQ